MYNIRKSIGTSSLCLVTLYIFISIICLIITPSFYTNILNPIFWTFMLFYILLDMKNLYIRFLNSRKDFLYMLLVSSAQVIMFFYMGFLFGFAKSPYSHRLLYILKNIITLVLPIVSIEITRTVLVIRNRNNKFVIAVITILLIENFEELWYNTKIRKCFLNIYVQHYYL